MTLIRDNQKSNKHFTRVESIQIDSIKCTSCHQIVNMSEYRFCPHCGYAFYSLSHNKNQVETSSKDYQLMLIIKQNLEKETQQRVRDYQLIQKIEPSLEKHSENTIKDYQLLHTIGKNLEKQIEQSPKANTTKNRLKDQGIKLLENRIFQFMLLFLVVLFFIFIIFNIKKQSDLNKHIHEKRETSVICYEYSPDCTASKSA